MHKHVQALINLKPNSSFVWKDEEDFSTLVYRTEESDVPTFDEIKAQAVKDEAEFKAQEYARNRQPEYPPIPDQLDALYHAGVFPKEMADKLKAVKDKYPKPE